jgi:hypothetical protein
MIRGMITSAQGAPRRTVVAAAAWSIPAVAVAVAAPNAAASDPVADLELFGLTFGAVGSGSTRLRPGDQVEFRFVLRNNGPGTIPAGAHVDLQVGQPDKWQSNFGDPVPGIGSGWTLNHLSNGFSAVLGTALRPGRFSAPAHLVFTYPDGAQTYAETKCSVDVTAIADTLVDTAPGNESARAEIEFLHRWAQATIALTATGPVPVDGTTEIAFDLHNGGPNTIQGEPTTLQLLFPHVAPERFVWIDPDADHSANLLGSTPGWSIVDMRSDETGTVVGLVLNQAVNIGADTRLRLMLTRAPGSPAGIIPLRCTSPWNTEVDILLGGADPQAEILFL